MNIEGQYLKLLKDVLNNGVAKKDRTGTGTVSIFGRQIRHKMSGGFPLLTTKKMYFRGIVTELLWFLRGDTNIKYLVDNDCHIWDGDVYKNYCKIAGAIEEPDYDIHVDDPNLNCTRLMTRKEFINKIKTDDKFAKKWGDLGPIYGRQWRAWGGYEKVPAGWHHGAPSYFQEKPILDQIANLINDLKTDPDSRRLMVTAWNPADLPVTDHKTDRDFNSKYGQKHITEGKQVLPPCHYGFQVYTRELNGDERWDLLKKNVGKGLFDSWVSEIVPFSGGLSEYLQSYNIPTRAISLMWNQRSVDTPLGLPFNIASYGLLLEIIAKTVNMIPDELIGNLGDVHIYTDQIEGVKEQMTREPFLLPTLNINTEFWPYEGGECGEGPLDAIAVFNAFKDENFCRCLLEEDIQLGNYQSHPAIKFPLSN